jgi:hypothetical protein
MADHGVVCSMSRSGNVWENAAIELLLVGEDPNGLRAECTDRGTTPRPTSSIILSASTIRNAGTRRSDIWPHGVRAEGWISLSTCQQNRVKLNPENSMDKSTVRSPAITSFCVPIPRPQSGLTRLQICSLTKSRSKRSLCASISIYCKKMKPLSVAQKSPLGIGGSMLFQLSE